MNNNRQAIARTFHTAIKWNGIAYLIRRGSYTLLSLYTYTYMAADAYVAWGTLMSIMYLTIYMVDAGLRKTIPLYVTSLSAKKHVKIIAGIYLCLSIAIAAGVTYTLPWLSPYTIIENHPYMTYCVPWLVSVHTMLIGTRLISHACLHNRTFTTRESIWTVGEVAVCICMLTYTSYSPLFLCISINAAATTGCLITAWIYIFSYIHSSKEQYDESRPNITGHMAYMWIIAMLKSISERNIIIPVLAWIAPASLVAMCKVTYDMVFFVYRALIKSIDINDTRFLKEEQARRFAFFKLSITVTHLAAIGAIVCIGMKTYSTVVQQYSELFTIMAVAAISELIVSPFERWREVHQAYTVHLIIYSIQAGCTIIILYSMAPIHTYKALLYCIAGIYVLRVAAGGILSAITYKQEHPPFPIRYVIMIFSIIVGLSYIV